MNNHVSCVDNALGVHVFGTHRFSFEFVRSVLGEKNNNKKTKIMKKQSKLLFLKQVMLF